MIQNFQGHTPVLHPTARAADSAALPQLAAALGRMGWRRAFLCGI